MTAIFSGIHEVNPKSLDVHLSNLQCVLVNHTLTTQDNVQLTNKKFNDKAKISQVVNHVCQAHHSSHITQFSLLSNLQFSGLLMHILVTILWKRDSFSN